MRRAWVVAALLAVGLSGLGAAGQALQPDSPDAVALGRRLFFDPALSIDRTVSCATCHDPAKGFADGLPVARGVHGILGTRNTPSIVNTGDNRTWFWDGRAGTLEEQVLGPIQNPKEMALPLADLEQRVGRPRADVATALASYLRTVRTGGSHYALQGPDHRDRLTDEERAGFRVFTGRGGCTRCHGGTNLGDFRFHNTGVAWRTGRMTDEGRYAVTHLDRDYGAFKTPGLMDVALTAPYMHDGSIATLEEVVDFYNDGGRENPYLDPSMRPLSLTDAEKSALVAFMKSLTGTVTEGVQAR
jgi:cytochrome c peroxidase